MESKECQSHACTQTQLPQWFSQRLLTDYFCQLGMLPRDTNSVQSLTFMGYRKFYPLGNRLIYIFLLRCYREALDAL
jgi:hypothetical protein